MTDQNRIGDGPIQGNFEKIMRSLAKTIDIVLNGRDNKDPKNGFVLMVYEFGDAGTTARTNYISNTKRDDVLALLKDQIKHFEAQKNAEGKN